MADSTQKETVVLGFDPDTWKRIEAGARREETDPRRWAEEAVADRARGGEEERAARLLEQFVQSLTRVLEESESLRGIGEEERQQFLAAIHGTARGQRMFLPKILSDLRREPAE